LLLDEPTNHLDLQMRHALSEALQEFEGALVLVSHDRHLLRITCDQLLLVDEGKVTAFAGDLDDYPAWLAGRRAGQDSPDATASCRSGVSRKDRRRVEADQRRNLQPLKNRLKALESRLADLSAQRGELERELALPGLYEPTAKSRLLSLMQQKHRLDADLEEAETAWLETGEALERQGVASL
jgi:ATP-binding cassette subfamily F protein 3